MPPITPFLHGERFDEETRRIGLALEVSCIALRVGDCDDGVRQALADKIIPLIKSGERNPDVLCEHVLQDVLQAGHEGGSRAEGNRVATLPRFLMSADEVAHKGDRALRRVQKIALNGQPKASMGSRREARRAG